MMLYDLDTMVMNHFKVDAIWFYTATGEPFYFTSHHNVEQDMLSISPFEIVQLFENKQTCDFYLKSEKGLYRVFGQKIEDANSTAGFIFSASLQDNRWIGFFEKEINRAEISFIDKDHLLPPAPKETVRIVRPLLSYNKATVEKMVITLNLPYLSLWKSTISTDNWLMSGALGLIVFFLIAALFFWVVFPLNRISKSLEKGNSYDIQPLIKNRTEMGNVARMINDYHMKTDELEASESVKRHIIEQAQVGIIISQQPSEIIITANPYACDLINAPEDAILGNVRTNFLPEFTPEQIDPAGSKHDKPQSLESILVNSKEEEIPILRTITNMFMDGKHVTMETFVDLREIKNLQDKLEEEKKKLSLAVKNSGLAFCEYNFTTDDITIPDEWHFMLKGNAKSKGQNILNNIYSSDIKKVTEQFDALVNGLRDTMMAEFRVNHPERGLIWLNVSVLITKRDHDRKPHQLIGLLQDITERINVQQELIKAKEKAEESDRMKSAYLGNMSHKIRTPLNAIVGFANLLTEEGVTNEEKSNFIDVIRRDTEQVLRLIDDIINIAKIDANQLSVNTQKVNINDVFGEVSDYFKAHEKTDKIKFAVKTMLPKGKDVVETDPDKLKEVLTNLLNNAFKFTEEGEVELGYFVNPVDKKLILYVKDTGIGIPDESKEKIFNRFYQVNLMTEGTGLGLTISRGLVNLMKGRLYFESKLYEGSTFFVEIPFEEV
jgi:signal transduction histidine kinase